MNREKELEVLETSLAMALEKRRPIDGDEAFVAVTDYSDVERFEREKERIFRRSFNVVTLATNVASPGDFITADVIGTPVIVARGEDGQLRAFLNVCRHRGATVELREQGHCKRFVCPYHAWTYNTDGTLHKVRHAEGFPTLDPSEHGLVEVPCMEAAGLVLVCPTPGHTPEPLPVELIEELEHVLGPRPTTYASSSKTWEANWKLVVEGGIESYHFLIAHRDTIAPFFGDTLSTWERIGSHIRSVLPKKSIKTLEETPREQWDIREHTHVVYTIHPNAMILLQRSHFDLILMNPIAVDLTHIEVLTVGTAPEDGDPSEKALRFLKENHAFSVRTLDEDFEIGEQIQRGLASGANTHFRFARFEGALTDWRQRIDAQVE
jgi:phenylpropionate dioxygenase-like ring-hydroxylating dioxygenase large terminal subunit